MQEIISADSEVIDGFGTSLSVAVQLQKAEIDQLITTARAYPRSMRRVQSAIMNMATLDEESAEECMYALPRGGKPIKGPSIRFAEILKQSFGNCRAGARVVDIDRVEMFIEAEGVFHDLETNASTTARVRRRISDKNGRLFKDDMIIVTGNAACSIAMRNAILAGVPKPLWRKAYDSVQATITGDITTLSENREKALKALAAFGVKPEQIYASLGREGLEDISVDDIGLLRGMYSALKNGEATVEEMFFGTVKPASTHDKIDDPLSDAPVKPAEAKQDVEFDPISEADEPHDPTTGELSPDTEASGASPDSAPDVDDTSPSPEVSSEPAGHSTPEPAGSPIPEFEPIPEKEFPAIRKFAKIAFSAAVAKGMVIETLTKVMNRSINADLGSVSSDTGRKAVNQIRDNAKAVLKADADYHSAVEFYAEMLGCEPADLMPEVPSDG